MKDKIVYFGDLRNKRSMRLYEKSLNSIKNNEEEEFYYILPNGRTINNYRERYLDDLGGLFQTNLFTFDDIVQNIVGHDEDEYIEGNIKYIHLRIVLNDIKQELNYYNNLIDKDGFIKNISNIISEFKNSLMTPENYLNNSPESEFYKEIGYIFKSYNNYLKNHGLQDREDLYLKAIEILEKESLDLNLKYIIIDEFYDFRPIEYKILELLIKENIDIYINIPYRKSNEVDYTKKTISKLKELNFEIIEEENTDDKSKTGFEKLGQVIFQNKEKIKFEENLKIYQSVDKELEIKKVFEIIKNKIRHKVNGHEIAIIYPNDEYLEIIKKQAELENLIISGEIEENLLKITIIKEILSVLKFHINNDKSNLLSRLKSGYFKSSYTEEEIKKLYTSLKSKKLNKLEEVEKYISENKAFDFEEKELQILNDFIKDMKYERVKFKGEKEIVDFNLEIRSLLNRYKVIEGLVETDNKDELIYNLKVLSILEETLEKMETNSKKLGLISLEDYYFILKGFLSEEGIIKNRNKFRGIQVIDLTSLRGFEFDTMFIVGLSQENYPNIVDSNFFINNRRVDTLRRIGLIIDNYESKFENEMMKMSKAIASCSNNLYLTYSLEERGNQSIFLDEIIRRIDFEKENIQKITYDYIIKSDMERVTRDREVLESVLYKYYKDDKAYKDYLSYLDINFSKEYNSFSRKSEMEISRETQENMEYIGKLNDKDIESFIYQNQKNKMYSSSYLEEYLNCPYAFMLNRILKKEDIYEDIEDYSFLDIGLLIHKSLQEYYEKFKKDIENEIIYKIKFDLKDSFEVLSEIVITKSKAMGYKINDPKDRYTIENLIVKLSIFIEEDIKRLKKHNLLPSEFEKPFKFKLSSEILMNGYIDRVDTNEKNETVVMDYKSSSGISSRNILEGKSLQLPIYIMSEKANNPIGGTYGLIKEAKIQTSLELEGSKLTTRKHNGRINEEEWNNLLDQTKNSIIKIREEILDSNFILNSEDCPPWCPYKDICRKKSI